MLNPTDAVIANTSSGRVRGRVIDGVARYLGIPYAAPPVGNLRFLPPEPHASWDEPRDATAFGPTAPYQLRDFPTLDLTPLVGTGWEQGDEYLNLNIWTPEGTHPAGLPVMVFIHGGAWVGGASSAPTQDGTSFARNGVVCVTINYRLGIEGFLPIPGVPTNLGLRDMIAALMWVRDNIAGFGGDPANVTVFGESAGAMSIADLVVSPPARGLFRRAIVQSGHGSMVRSVTTMRKVVHRLAKLLGVSANAAGFRSASVQAGLDAQDVVQAPTAGLDMRGENGRDPAYGLSKFLPVHGDDVIPVPPLQALAKLHALAAADLVEEQQLGRPRQQPEVAARLDLLTGLVTGGSAVAAPVLAGVAHGEMLTVAPFGSSDGVVARAVSRLVTMATGLDPHGLGVPEVYWLRRADEYRSAAAGFASGDPEAVGSWLLMCCQALEDGAREALSIADAAVS